MRIAITCPASLPAYQFGGILIVSVNLAKYLSKLGHDVSICTTDLNFSSKSMIFDKGLPRVEKIQGFTVKRSHIFFKIFFYFVSPGTYNSLVREKPDIIHAISARAYQSFIAAIVSKLHNIPLVVSDYGGLTTHPNVIHGSIVKRFLYKLQTPILKFIMNQASTVIAANNYEVQDFSPLTKKEKIVIVPNGIDFHQLQSIPFDFKSKHNLKERLILFVGRFDKLKGIDLLLKSFSQVCSNDKFAEVFLVILGSNFGFKDEMFKMIKELKIENKLIVIENPSREEVISAYHACEFLVLPSRWELSPLTPLEGFACKKPVISMNTSGIPYVIEDGKTGILVEPENIDDLTKSIINLLKDKQKSKELGIAGFEMVKNKFNLEKMTNSILQIYTNLIPNNHTNLPKN